MEHAHNALPDTDVRSQGPLPGSPTHYVACFERSDVNPKGTVDHTKARKFGNSRRILESVNHARLEKAHGAKAPVTWCASTEPTL